MYEKGFINEGFEWISYDDHENSVISYLRKGNNPDQNVLVVCNFTPALLKKYKVGIPSKLKLKEIFNSDAKEFWGTGVVYNPLIPCVCLDKENKWYELTLQLPALSAVVLK